MTRQIFDSPFKALLITLSLLLVSLFTVHECEAQCGHGGWTPIGENDGNPGAPGTPGPGTPGAGTPSTAGPSTAGPSTPKVIPPPGSTTPRGGPSGGMTRKRRTGATNFVTWELWWARNRYQFFEIQDLFDNAAALYPVTGQAPGTDAGEERNLFTGLRQGSLTAIKPFLDDDAPLLRRIALFALGRLKDHESVELMIERLQDNNHYVRDAAILGLGINGSPDARHIIMHIALGTDTACRTLGESIVPAYVRAIATVTLSLTGTPGMEPVLQGIAMDSEAPNDVRAMAVEGLGLLGGPGPAGFLAGFIKDPKLDPRLVSHAVCALCKTGEEMGLPTLKKCLSSKQLPVRQAAAMGIWRLIHEGDPYWVKQISKSYENSRDQAVKGFSLLSMGLIGGKEAVSRLNQIARKGPTSERGWACLALGFALRDVKDRAAMDYLIRQTKDSGNRSTRGAACVALGLCGDRAAVPGLIKILQKGDDPYLRGYAAMGLGLINDPSALGPLRYSLKNDHLPQVLGQTVLALGLMHDLQSAPDLMKCMIDTPNIIIKGMISRSLQYMGDAAVVGDILEELTTVDHDYRTTKECICLLSRLLSGQTGPYLDRLAANTNFVNEYAVVNHLLEYGL